MKLLGMIGLCGICLSCQCLCERAQVFHPRMPWHTSDIQEGAGDTVVLLHGVLSSKYPMSKLQRRLAKEGYRVVNVAYPSTKADLDGLAQYVAKEVDAHVKPGQTVHFVTHSLGGIVLRKVSHEEHPWKIGRVMMLAPPNQGSEVVDFYQKIRLHWVLGPAGDFLSTAAMKKVPPARLKGKECAIIMGNSPWTKYYQPLLDGENDGTVTVRGGRLGIGEHFATVPCSHSFIMVDDKVVDMAVQFLKEGKLPPGA